MGVTVAVVVVVVSGNRGGVGAGIGGSGIGIDIDKMLIQLDAHSTAQLHQHLFWHGMPYLS